MRKIIISIIIFTVLLGLAGIWYWQRNPYSKDVLKLEILGPEQADISEEVEYTVKYKNNGNIRLDEPQLIFEFPEHTLLPEGQTTRQEIGGDKMEDIYPGEEKIFKFKGRLLGKEGEVKTAKVWLSYRPKNLKPRYESSTTLSTVIKPAPLTFEFDLPSKIETGRDFKFFLNYFSSLNYPLTNLRAKIDYPGGFEFLESKPRSLGQTEWDLPVLNKAEGGRVEVQGRLSGGVDEQKIFRASLGVWLDDEFISLKEITRGVEIVKPSLYVFQRINGNDQYTANPGDVLHYEVFFRNIGDEVFNNLFLVVNLDGSAFDLDSVRSDFGKFNKSDKSVMWDWRDVSKLQLLSEGDEGKVDFWVNVKSDWQVASQDRNLTLKDSVLISRLKEEFQIKVNSKLTISQKGYFYDEAFGNTGPIPPKAGEATTYTIIWQARNYFNDAKNVMVRATLPQNVSLTGKFFPEGEVSKFSFDNQSREIIWRIGDGQPMTGGEGISNTAPNIAFQVSFTPGTTQKGQTSSIISEATITGEDQWTGSSIESRAGAVSTTLLDDPNVSDHSGIIQ